MHMGRGCLGSNLPRPDFNGVQHACDMLVAMVREGLSQEAYCLTSLNLDVCKAEGSLLGKAETRYESRESARVFFEFPSVDFILPQSFSSPAGNKASSSASPKLRKSQNYIANVMSNTNNSGSPQKHEYGFGLRQVDSK